MSGPRAMIEIGVLTRLSSGGMMGRLESGCLLPAHGVSDSALDIVCHLIIILALQMRTEAQRAPEMIPLERKGEGRGGRE